VVTTQEVAMSKRLLVFSLLVALAACDTPTPVAPAGDGSGVHPEFGTSNGPVIPGHSFVIRSNDEFFLTSVDEANDLVVRHYNTEDIDFCGGGTAPPTAEAQLVLTPGAAIYTWKTGVLPVYVYRLSEVPPQDVSEQFCIDLTTKWIYRGTHQLTNHDNNLFFDPGRIDAFGWNAQGTVFDRAGKEYSYLESFLGVADPDRQRDLHFSYRLSIK
jgi:hypothetical protein